MRDRRLLAGVYLSLQGVSVVSWWAILIANPALDRYFFAPDVEWAAVSKFMVPDILVMGGGSLIAGWGFLTGAKWASGASLIAVGAVAYGLVGALAVNWPIGTCWVADVVMVGSMAGTVWAARSGCK